MEDPTSAEVSNTQIDEMLKVYNDILAASNKFKSTLDKVNTLSWDGSKVSQDCTKVLDNTQPSSKAHTLDSHY